MKRPLLFTLIGSLTLVLIAPLSSKAQCGPTAGPGGGTIFFNTTLSGGSNWTQPQNAQASDNVFATFSQTVGILATAQSNYLTATGLGFNIPTTASICGVTVTVTRKRLDLLLGDITDNSVKLVSGGSIGGAEHASSTSWSTTTETVTYGGSADLWGLTLTPAIVNNANFGVGVSAKLTGGPLIALMLQAGIDYISVTITYNSGTLAITLSDFSAVRQDNTNVLNWTASSDNQADEFIVQRSADSKNWQDLATVPAIQHVYQYSYTDNTPLNGTNFYRLFLKNADAQGTWSAIRQIAQTVTGITCYPNPVINTINITSPVPIQQVSLKDMQGKTLQTRTPGNGTTSLQLSATGLPPGIYLLQVDGKIFKLLKQ